MLQGVSDLFLKYVLENSDLIFERKVRVVPDWSEVIEHGGCFSESGIEGVIGAAIRCNDGAKVFISMYLWDFVFPF